VNLTPRLPWPFFAVGAGLSLVAVFVATKIGADSVTPFLFAAIALGVNCIGHVVLTGIDMARGKKIHVPVKALLPVILAIGIIISSNDVNSVLMFAANAPLSISSPLQSTLIVVLSVLFGLIFLKERMNLQQKLGLAAAIIGIAMLNA
jgi:drug/metabolite transporter (DMT)-like permease